MLRDGQHQNTLKTNSIWNCWSKFHGMIRTDAKIPNLIMHLGLWGPWGLDALGSLGPLESFGATARPAICGASFSLSAKSSEFFSCWSFVITTASSLGSVSISKLTLQIPPWNCMEMESFICIHGMTSSLLRLCCDIQLRYSSAAVLHRLGHCFECGFPKGLRWSMRWSNAIQLPAINLIMSTYDRRTGNVL